MAAGQTLQTATPNITQSTELNRRDHPPIRIWLTPCLLLDTKKDSLTQMIQYCLIENQLVRKNLQDRRQSSSMIDATNEAEKGAKNALESVNSAR